MPMRQTTHDRAATKMVKADGGHGAVDVVGDDVADEGRDDGEDKGDAPDDEVGEGGHWRRR